MALLWVRDAVGWQAQELTGKRFDLAALFSLPVRGDVDATCHDTCREHPASAGPAWLVAAESGGPPLWALVASRKSNARVNGCPPVAGLRILSDRDEIRIGAASQMYFSTESPAAVVPFPAPERADHIVRCGRCRLPINPGDPAVRCPRCALWFHQFGDSQCWTYNNECVGFCGQPTALDAGFSWAPED